MTWNAGSRRFAVALILILLTFLTLAAGGQQSSNLIQIENALPGTTDWMLSNPASNHEIEGYASYQRQSQESDQLLCEHY